MKSFVAMTFVALISSRSIVATLILPDYKVLVRKQEPEVSPACGSACQPAVTIYTQCMMSNGQPADADTAAKCECTDDFSSKVEACSLCALSDGVSQSNVQQVLHDLTAFCQKNGHPFNHPPGVSGGGGSGSGSGSSSASSPAAGGSNTAPSSGNGGNSTGSSTSNPPARTSAATRLGGVPFFVAVAVIVSGMSRILFS